MLVKYTSFYESSMNQLSVEEYWRREISFAASDLSKKSGNNCAYKNWMDGVSKVSDWVLTQEGMCYFSARMAA